MGMEPRGGVDWPFLECCCLFPYGITCSFALVHCNVRKHQVVVTYSLL